MKLSQYGYELTDEMLAKYPHKNENSLQNNFV